ncbi:hypothetical protein H2200_001684 [Cladophialophora chaetospira]|uniref:Peptidase A1 domain-containing protein n=1 Tax=Cladophialophora chaetospira TaxID=386627 RepID=A0AA39CPB0_9EURO|nr:hypothetical protein H2200_001684 [Cladophialophora chaetospira]
MHNQRVLVLALTAFTPAMFVSASRFPQHLALNRRSQSATLPLVSTSLGTVFDVNVTFGNQTIPLLVDTGSSDTYVMAAGYHCYDNSNGTELPQADCLYGDATYTKTATYSEIPGEIFGVQYGDGIASGVMANEDVSIGGITVRGAKIGVANASTPMGDGVNSGLIGLAYPAFTSAHPANATDNTTYFYNRITYDPLLFTMHKQGLIDPYFSIALARTPQNVSSGFGGYLSLGALPPVPHSDEFTHVPVEINLSVPTNVTSDESVLGYWTLTVSSIVYGPGRSTANQSDPQPNNLTQSSTSTNSTPFQAFLDNGNYFSFLPDEVVTNINGFFDPPAMFDPTTGLWAVDCAATPPQVGLEIGNQTFFLDGRDLVYQTADPASSEALCISNILSSDFEGDITINILGAAFYKNVLTLHDFGSNEIRLAKLTGEVTESQEQGQGQNGSGNGNAGSGSTNGTASENSASTLEILGGQWSILAVLATIVGMGVGLLGT